MKQNRFLKIIFCILCALFSTPKLHAETSLKMEVSSSSRIVDDGSIMLRIAFGAIFTYLGVRSFEKDGEMPQKLSDFVYGIMATVGGATIFSWGMSEIMPSLLKKVTPIQNTSNKKPPSRHFPPWKTT